LDYCSEEFAEKPAPTRASFGKFPGSTGVQPVFSLKNCHSTQPFPAGQPNLCISWENLTVSWRCRAAGGNHEWTWMEAGGRIWTTNGHECGQFRRSAWGPGRCGRGV